MQLKLGVIYWIKGDNLVTELTESTKLIIIGVSGTGVILAALALYFMFREERFKKKS